MVACLKVYSSDTYPKAEKKKCYGSMGVRKAILLYTMSRLGALFFGEFLMFLYEATLFQIIR